MPTIKTGRVLYSPFSDLSDKVGGRTWTNVNAATFVTTPAKIGNALGLVRASAQKLTLADEAAWNFGASFSISVWVNATSVAVTQRILGQFSLGVDHNFMFGIGNAAAGDVYCFLANAITDSANLTRTSGTPITATVWYHVVMVYDGSLANADRIKFYVDGVQQATTVVGTIATATRNSAALLECGGVTGDPDYFGGYLDELYVTTQALTLAQSKKLYNAGNGFAYPFRRGVMSPSTLCPKNIAA